MVYRITYKGEEVCSVRSHLKLSIHEIIHFIYSDGRAAFESGVPGFCREGDNYHFDYTYAEMKVTKEETI